MSFTSVAVTAGFAGNNMIRAQRTLAAFPVPNSSVLQRGNALRRQNAIVLESPRIVPPGPLKREQAFYYTLPAPTTTNQYATGSSTSTAVASSAMEVDDLEMPDIGALQIVPNPTAVNAFGFPAQ